METIRNMTSSYIEIVSKTTRDLVPKAIMYLIVNKVCGPEQHVCAWTRTLLRAYTLHQPSEYVGATLSDLCLFGNFYVMCPGQCLSVRSVVLCSVSQATFHRTLECGGESGITVPHFHLQLKEFIKSDLMGNVYAGGDQVSC